MKKHIKGLLAVAFAFSISGEVFAQVPPPSVEAGAVNRRIESDIERKIKDIKETKKEDTAYEEKIEKTEKIDGTVQKTGFVLKDVQYEGNTVYSEEELDNLIADKVGVFIGLDELKEIMNAVTNHYTDEGYITSFSYLPAQKIKNGVLKISIIESKVSSVTIKGNKWAKTGFLKNNIFKDQGVTEGKIFNVKNLRKALGEINELNYLKGRVILQKGEDMESAEIILEAKDRFPLMFNAGYDNRGRNIIGKQRAVLTVADENITGWGDRLYISNILASRTYGLNTSYFLPLGPYGTELRLGYGFSDVSLGKDYRIQKINGRAHNFTIGFIQPIYEGKTFKLESDITFDMLTSTTFINGGDVNHRYNSRAIRTGLNAIKDDTTGRWVSRFEISAGVPIFGATKEGLPFLKLNPSIVRIQNFPYKITGLLRAAGQYSPNKLQPVEQLQVGGMNSVRGFEEGLNFGDKGYFITLELRKTIPCLPDYKFIKLKDKLALAVFYDQGLATTKNVAVGYHRFLQSVGFGFRYNINKYLHANLDFGVPLGKDRTGDQQGMRFHFNISSGII